jgi:hypothetical protein
MLKCHNKDKKVHSLIFLNNDDCSIALYRIAPIPGNISVYFLYTVNRVKDIQLYSIFFKFTCNVCAEKTNRIEIPELQLTEHRRRVCLFSVN